jgi:hypothetical protein
MLVHEIFRSLLANTNGNNALNTSQPLPMTVQSTGLPSSSSLSSSPPRKNAIRYVENGENNRREKYDGRRWRTVCSWSDDSCTNFAASRNLCLKHNGRQRKRKTLTPKKSTTIGYN